MKESPRLIGSVSLWAGGKLLCLRLCLQLQQKSCKASDLLRLQVHAEEVEDFVEHCPVPRNKLATILAKERPPGRSKPHGVEDFCMGCGEGHDVSCLAAISANRVISGSTDSTLKIWDLESRCCTATLKGHKGEVTCVAATLDGSRAVSGSRDRTLRVWDLKDNKKPCCRRTLKGHADEVLCVAATQKSDIAVSGSRDSTLK
eukprot:scaffold103606_cov36-Prasinocladus_malaysianus.AAC.1